MFQTVSVDKNFYNFWEPAMKETKKLVENLNSQMHTIVYKENRLEEEL